MAENEIKEVPNENTKLLREENPDNDLSIESVVEWSDDKFVWDESELEKINSVRKKENKVPLDIIKRYQTRDIGIRAHPDMTVWKCLYSLILLHQNEFVFMWLYLSFAVYFFI